MKRKIVIVNQWLKTRKDFKDRTDFEYISQDDLFDESNSNYIANLKDTKILLFGNEQIKEKDNDVFTILKQLHKDKVVEFLMPKTLRLEDTLRLKKIIFGDGNELYYDLVQSKGKTEEFFQEEVFTEVVLPKQRIVSLTDNLEESINFLRDIEDRLILGHELGFDFETKGFPENINFNPLGLGLSFKDIGYYFILRDFNKNHKEQLPFYEKLFNLCVTYNKQIWAFNTPFEIRVLYYMSVKLFGIGIFLEIQDTRAYCIADQNLRTLKISATYYLNVPPWTEDLYYQQKYLTYIFENFETLDEAIEWSSQEDGYLDIFEESVADYLQSIKDDSDTLERIVENWGSEWGSADDYVLGKYCINDSFYTLLIMEKLRLQYPSRFQGGYDCYIMNMYMASSLGLSGIHIDPHLGKEISDYYDKIERNVILFLDRTYYSLKVRDLENTYKHFKPMGDILTESERNFLLYQLTSFVFEKNTTCGYEFLTWILIDGKVSMERVFMVYKDNLEEIEYLFSPLEDTPDEILDKRKRKVLESVGKRVKELVLDDLAERYYSKSRFYNDFKTELGRRKTLSKEALLYTPINIVKNYDSIRFLKCLSEVPRGKLLEEDEHNTLIKKMKVEVRELQKVQSIRETFEYFNKESLSQYIKYLSLLIKLDLYKQYDGKTIKDDIIIDPLLEKPVFPYHTKEKTKELGEFIKHKYKESLLVYYLWNRYNDSIMDHSGYSRNAPDKELISDPTTFYNEIKKHYGDELYYSLMGQETSKGFPYSLIEKEEWVFQGLCDRFKTITHDANHYMSRLLSQEDLKESLTFDLVDDNEPLKALYKLVGMARIYDVGHKVITTYNKYYYDSLHYEILGGDVVQFPRKVKIKTKGKKIKKVKTTRPVIDNSVPRMLAFKFLPNEKSTKRWASPLHTLPPKEDIRLAMVVPEDQVLFYIDISACEVRSIAYMGKVKNFMDAFDNGRDVYVETAKLCYPEEFERMGEKQFTKEFRKLFKTLTLAVLYGLSDARLASQADITKEKAIEVKEKLLSLDVNLYNYLKESIDYARETSKIKTILGDKMYCNVKKLSTLAFNNKIQGFSAVILAEGFYNLNRSMEYLGYKVSCKSVVHDSVLNQLDCRYLLHYRLMYNKFFKDYIQEVYHLNMKFDLDLSLNFLDKGSFEYDPELGIFSLSGYPRDVEYYNKYLSQVYSYEEIKREESKKVLYEGSLEYTISTLEKDHLFYNGKDLEEREVVKITYQLTKPLEGLEFLEYPNRIPDEWLREKYRKVTEKL